MPHQQPGIPQTPQIFFDLRTISLDIRTETSYYWVMATETTTRKLSIDGETLVRMAEMLEDGAKLYDLRREFPFHRGNQIADLVAGWE